MQSIAPPFPVAALILLRLYCRLHRDRIEPGRAIGHAHHPPCAVCPLQQHCEYLQTVVKPNPGASRPNENTE